MARSIATLQSKYGRGGGFLSSHPSNPKRLENLQKSLTKRFQNKPLAAKTQFG